jgi:catechol 2,3-dioxygenase-like lactoylglutathione lyase family enzyme
MRIVMSVGPCSCLIAAVVMAGCNETGEVWSAAGAPAPGPASARSAGASAGGGAGATGGGGAPDASVGVGAAAFIGGAGIGVADLDVSFEFYSTVFGMELRYELAVPGYANEKIIYFKGGTKGSDVVLINFTDGRPHNYAKNPVKLVFYVPNAKQTIEAIRGKGFEVLSEPTPQPAFMNAVVGFGRDPDGYILEIIEQPTLTGPYLAAFGIGVSDLDKTKDFYTRVMGMVVMGSLIKVPNVWDEWILQHKSGKGSALVLLHFTDGSARNYKDNPIKTAHFVEDARALAAKVEQEGITLMSQPMTFPVQGTNALISLARDPDGYGVELITTLP